MPPTAAFTANPMSGDAQLTVQFNDTSTGDPTSWFWEFGDNEFSYDRNASHTYNDTGTYTVSLTVTNANGSDTATEPEYINVESPGIVPLEAAFTANVTEGTAPLAVQFTDMSTGDPTTWIWFFGDDGTSSEQHPEHTYTRPGIYTVSLTVVSEGKDSAETKIDYINVTNQTELDPIPPTTTLTGTPTTGDTPPEVQINDTSTPDPTSWPEESRDDGTSTEQNPEHTYTEQGTDTVSLPATNEGGSDTATQNITVPLGPQKPPFPTASFMANVTEGTAPLAVQFSDESTGDPTSWLWEFGDGSTSIDRNPEHTYADQGTYTVRLSVSSAAGSNESVREDYITVSSTPPLPIIAVGALAGGLVTAGGLATYRARRFRIQRERCRHSSEHLLHPEIEIRGGVEVGKEIRCDIPDIRVEMRGGIEDERLTEEDKTNGED
jgi:PKD repeat protein